MAIVNSREGLKNWCLRQLGHPVIEINIDDDQLDDRIDEALEYFRQFHYDGTELTYLSHQVTELDKTNRYFTISENIIGVTKVFPIVASNATVNMFDLRYQLRLHELYDFTSASYVNYALTQQHITTLNMLFAGENPIRFNRHTDRLYCDWDWQHDVEVGEYIIIECKVVIDPEVYNKVYDDRMLKKYATELVKRQWGANLKKYGNLQLPGGVIMNGQQIFDEAVNEIIRLETEIRDTYEAPPQFIVA